LEVVVRQLITHGFDHITMAVNHQAEVIKAFLLMAPNGMSGLIIQ